MYSIAIDGPSGAGKSTIAKIIAKKLKIVYLDTGAMYRAAALKCLDMSLNPENERDAEKVICGLDIQICYKDGTQCIFLDNKDVSTRIREHHMSKAASDISKHKCVRLKLVALQREIASSQNIIMDGRDIGTYVLPNAKYKFFLTASAEVRAKRRFDELIAKGEVVEFDKVLSDIIQRDKNDSEREFAPLKQAKDAIVVDSSYLSIDEVVELILESLDV